MADNDFIVPQIANGGAGSVQAGGVRAPDYRQVQAPEEVDVRHIDMAATEAGDARARAAAALGRIFKDFEAQSAAIGTHLAKNAGAQAGAVAGMDPNFKPVSGLAAISAYGDAYNAAAHVSFINNARQTVEQSLDRAEQDSPADPVAFQTQAQAIADGALKETPSIYQPELQQAYGMRIAAGVTRLRGQAITQAKSDALDSYLTTVDSRINSAIQTASTLPDEQRNTVMSQLAIDNQAQLAALVRAGAITQGRAEILAQKFGDTAETAVHKNYTGGVVNSFMNYARAGDVDAADRAAQRYLTDPANSPDDVAAVFKAYNAQVDALHQQQSRLHADDIAKVGQLLVQDPNQPVGQGAFGPKIESQIHALYKSGALTPEGLHSLLDQSMRNQVRSIGDDTDYQLVFSALNGGQKLDPNDKDQVKAADTYFKTHVSLSGIPALSDAWTAGVSSFAKQTNIVPPAALSQIRIGLLSTDPVTAARAAASAERIRAANPQLDPYDKDTRSAALASEINSNLKVGMGPQQAVQLATQTVNRDEGERKIIDKNYAKIIQQNPDSNRKALQSALDAATPGLFAHAPAVPVAMQAENERLVSTYYGLTQNIDTARQLAAKQIQTTWGVSRMNGQAELTKYPPERLGVSSDVIRSDVASSAAAAGYTGDASQIHLTPNAYTDSTNGRVWTLTHVDAQTGMPDVLLDKNNQPLMYHVPQGQDFAKARQSLINQKIAAARAERDQQRQNASDQMMFEKQLADQYLGATPAQRAMAGR
jgi:hypothetical protein